MSNGKSLSALQGMRGVAALLVVADHAIGTYDQRLGSIANMTFAWHLGELGVCIFFAISGVVMMVAHGDDFGKTGAIRSFVLKRTLRIVPLFWITTLIHVAKVELYGQVAWSDFVLSLLLIPHEVTGRTFGSPIYGLGWTLQYELFFYAIFAFALLLRERIAVPLIAVSMLLLASYGQAHLHEHTVIAYWCQPIILYFLSGIGIGCVLRYLRSGGVRAWQPSFETGLLVSVSIVIVEICINTLLPNAADRPLAPLAAPLAVALCTLCRAPNSTGILGTACITLGDMSYSLYLTHSFALGPLGRGFAKIGIDPPLWLFILVAIVVSLLLARGVYEFVERPILVRARALLNAPATA